MNGMVKMKSGKWIAVATTAAVLILTGILSFGNKGGTGAYPEEQTVEPVPSEKEQVADMIQIYVTGEVLSPGIVELEKGSLITDAVEACGGFTENASGNINLVYPLDRNATLIIKESSDGGGVTYIDDAGDAMVIDEEKGMIDGRININNADSHSLCMLPGIGEKTAGDIIEYREENGDFEAIEDIMNVSGIKENKFAAIMDYICVK